MLAWYCKGVQNCSSSAPAHADLSVGCSCFRPFLCTGFGSYIFGMTEVGYTLTGGDATPGNRLLDVIPLTTTRLIGYGMCIIFIGAPSALLLF